MPLAGAKACVWANAMGSVPAQRGSLPASRAVAESQPQRPRISLASRRARGDASVQAEGPCTVLVGTTAVGPVVATPAFRPDSLCEYLHVERAQPFQPHVMVVDQRPKGHCPKHSCARLRLRQCPAQRATTRRSQAPEWSEATNRFRQKFRRKAKRSPSIHPSHRLRSPNACRNDNGRRHKCGNQH